MKTLTPKIVTLEALAETASQYRDRGLKVVLCHGTFDLLHPGHIRHLKKARELGDCLLVTITADRYVSKGPNRPVFPGPLRAESLAALDVVDHVAIVEDATAMPAIDAIRPHLYVKGKDYSNAKDDLTGNILLEKNRVELHGGEVCFTDEITFSSSKIINQHLDVFSSETRGYLNNFKERYQDQQILDSIHAFASKRILVFGDAIVDEYCHVDPMGLTGKSGNILACRFNHTEQFAGGSLAIANHLSGFISQVGLAAGIGRDPIHEGFIRGNLAANVQPNLFHYEAAPTLVKRRYVSADTHKLFEIYYYNPDPLTPGVEKEICAWLAEYVAGFDAVVVADYGNGLISPAMIETVCRHAKFLAVNTQINSGNHCHHVIHRYPRADFISLNEPEVRLATHNRHDPIEPLARNIGKILGARWFAITRGTEGAMMLDLENGETHMAPALSTRVVDRIGAGDAFLSLAGLSLACGLPADVALFLGSTAAALDVQIVCNRESIHPTLLLKYVSTLMK